MDIIKKLIALFGGNKLVDQKMPVADQEGNDAGDNGADDAGAPTLSLAPDTSKPSEEQRSESIEKVSQNEAGPVTVEVQAPAVIEKTQQRPADKSEDPRETEYPAEAFLTSPGCEIKPTSECHLEDVLIDYEKKSVGNQYTFTAPEEVAKAATQQAATESDSKSKLLARIQARNDQKALENKGKPLPANLHALIKAARETEERIARERQQQQAAASNSSVKDRLLANIQKAEMENKGKQLPDVSRYIEAARKRNEELERNRELQQQQQQQNRSQGPSLKM